MPKQVQRVLDEPVMGFLALVSLFLGLVPAVFDETPRLSAWLTAAEIGIVAAFALEYLSGLALAPSRARFVRDPWRVLDAAIIVLALVGLVPPVSDALRSSPALRLIRLGRFALLGTRSRSRLIARAAYAGEIVERPAPALEVHALDRKSHARFEAIDWPAALERMGSPDPDWLIVSGVSGERLGAIAEAIGVPEDALRRVFDADFPRFDRLERHTALFAWYPLPDADGGRVPRTPVLLVGSAQNVVVLTRERADLIERVERRLGDVAPEIPGMVRASYALVAGILRAYDRVAERLEGTLAALESGEVAPGDDEFLARTFRLRADIARVRANLKHLKTVVRDLAGDRIAIHGFEPGHRDLFAFLADDADDLYENVDDLRETLGAVVDLRLNVSSFQMNRVMRLLALLTALALIPATAGGLLGMNVLGSPWPATLGQVAFGVAGGMALSLYVFAVKGWLR